MREKHEKKKSICEYQNVISIAFMTHIICKLNLRSHNKNLHGLIMLKKRKRLGTSLAVQWLRLHASTAGGAGSMPGRGLN